MLFFSDFIISLFIILFLFSTTSPNVGEDHRVFWNVIRPVKDGFWSAHHPGDRWNCKCSLEQTDKDATPVPYAIVHNEGLRAGRGKGFKMPKRQFIGESAVLNNKISLIIDEELTKILDL